MKAELFLGARGISNVEHLSREGDDLLSLLKKYADIQCIAFGEHLSANGEEFDVEECYKFFKRVNKLK